MSSMLRTDGGAGLDSAFVFCAAVAILFLGKVDVVDISSMLLTGDCVAGGLVLRRAVGFLDVWDFPSSMRSTSKRSSSRADSRDIVSSGVDSNMFIGILKFFNEAEVLCPPNQMYNLSDNHSTKD